MSPFPNLGPLVGAKFRQLVSISWLSVHPFILKSRIMPKFWRSPLFFLVSLSPSPSLQESVRREIEVDERQCTLLRYLRKTSHYWSHYWCHKIPAYKRCQKHCFKSSKGSLTVEVKVPWMDEQALFTCCTIIFILGRFQSHRVIPWDILFQRDTTAEKSVLLIKVDGASVGRCSSST